MMNNQTWITLLVEPILDGVIAGGTGYLAIATQGNIPSTGAIVACLIGAAIAAARSAQKLLTPPPGDHVP
jgi:hypothetical protein